MLDLFNRIMTVFDNLFRVFEILLYVATAGVGAYLGWQIGGALDFSMVAQIGTAAGLAVVSTLCVAIIWGIMKLIN